MKKYLLFLVAAILATVARAADGDTFTYQGLNFKVISEEDHTVMVVKNKYASGDISIPSTVVRSGTSYTVTVIGGEAFPEQSTVTSVTIPASVTKINSAAFYYCSTLTSVTIPASVTEIGGYAFYRCTKLESVEIPGPVTIIREQTFYECRSLTSVILPETLTEIGREAFWGCSSLISINIPASVTEIGSFAFCGCGMTSVAIPDLVTRIDEYTFAACRNLTSVTLPKSLRLILTSGFSDCTNLTTIYCLNPDYIELFLLGVFNGCNTSSITVYIPKGSLDRYLQKGWDCFKDIREMGAFDVALSEHTLELTAGNTATITATVTKDDDMTVESEEWSSSNPEVATVDNGVITAVAPGKALIQFTAVAANGLPRTESCTVTVSESAGVADVVTDSDASVDVYNLQGVAVLRDAAASELGNLPAGLYIVRQGKSVKKIAVK